MEMYYPFPPIFTLNHKRLWKFHTYKCLLIHDIRSCKYPTIYLPSFAVTNIYNKDLHVSIIFFLSWSISLGKFLALGLFAWRAFLCYFIVFGKLKCVLFGKFHNSFRGHRSTRVLQNQGWWPKCLAPSLLRLSHWHRDMPADLYAQRRVVKSRQEKETSKTIQTWHTND